MEDAHLCCIDVRIVSLSAHVTFKVNDHRCIMDPIRVPCRFFRYGARDIIRNVFGTAKFYCSFPRQPRLFGGWRCQKSAATDSLRTISELAWLLRIPNAIAERVARTRVAWTFIQVANVSRLRLLSVGDQRFLISGASSNELRSILSSWNRRTFPKERNTRDFDLITTDRSM